MSDSLHLYERIAAQLRGAIVSGEYRAEDMLPSENELARSYGASRVTIRRALGELENEGLVRALHGKGYFVEQPHHTNFTLDLRELRPGEVTRYRRITLDFPDEETRRALALGPESGRERVVSVWSVVERGEDVVACDEKYTKYERAQPTIEREINYVEFADMFAERFPPVSIWVELSLSVEAAPERVAGELGCAAGTPMLVARKLIRSRPDERIGYSRRWYSPLYGALEARSGYYVTGRL